MTKIPDLGAYRDQPKTQRKAIAEGLACRLYALLVADDGVDGEAASRIHAEAQAFGVWDDVNLMIHGFFDEEWEQHAYPRDAAPAEPR